MSDLNSIVESALQRTLELELAGDKREAIRVLKDLLDIYPDQEEAIRGIKRLELALPAAARTTVPVG